MAPHFAPDARAPLASLFSAFDRLAKAGWTVYELCTQCDGTTQLPIRAYASGGPAKRVLIGGIHGREPAGAMALAHCVDPLIEHGRSAPLLVLPLLNPWGYLHHQRYGPTGQSVSDSDHWLGRAALPACAEAAAITQFIMEGADIAPGAAVLDLHEDPIYEAPGYHFDGRGSYVYVAGTGAAAHALTQRTQAFLAQSAMPLVASGVTRFGETLRDGLIIDSADGSIDELLAVRRGCSPVLTTEILLHAPEDPPLAARVAHYCGLIDVFLD